MAPSRDWSLLPDEAIEQICNQLLAKDLTEYIRFRAVCQSWRRPTADPRNFSNRFRPHNWILLMDHDGSMTGQHRQFLNISTGNVLRVHVPELRSNDHIVSAVADGLLFLRHIETGCLFLLNPFTRAMVHFPKFVYLIRDGECMRYPFITGAVVTSSLTVILCSFDSRLIGIAKPGDRCWQLISRETQLFSSLFFNDCLYAVTMANTIIRFKSATKQFVPVVHCNIGSDTASYLVESDGQMLLVCLQNVRHYRGISSIKIFRVQPDNGKLVQVESIGDRALFIGKFRCLSVSTEIFPSIERNCIYFGADQSLESKIYNIGKCSFYASPKSNLVIQLASYCCHVTWQKYLSYGSLTTDQDRKILWDGEEDKRGVDHENFPSPAALPDLVIPTCDHIAQSPTWRGSCTHGFPSYSELTTSDIRRIGLKRWLTFRELFAVLLNPSFYVDLKVNGVPYEPKEGVRLVPNSILVASRAEPSSFFSSLSFSEDAEQCKTLKISNIPLMKRVIMKSEAWIMRDVTIISSIRGIFHLIHVMKNNQGQKKSKRPCLRGGLKMDELAKELAKTKACLEEVVQNEQGTARMKQTLNSVIAKLDGILSDIDAESEQ